MSSNFLLIYLFKETAYYKKIPSELRKLTQHKEKLCLSNTTQIYTYCNKSAHEQESSVKYIWWYFIDDEVGEKEVYRY